MRRARWFRAVVLAVTVMFVMGCTQLVHVTVPVDEPGRMKGAYQIETLDGASFTTDRLSISDSMLVFSSVLRDGKRYAVEPVRIPVEEVAQIHQVRANRIIVAGVVVVAALFVAFWIAVANIEWNDS